MAPQLVTNFWTEVGERLVARYNLSPGKATRLVNDYRRDVAVRDVGETVYNRGVDQIASSIATAEAAR